MAFLVARTIHLVYLLLLTGAFWLAVSQAWKRRRRHAPTAIWVGVVLGLLILIWFFVYPPVQWVISAGRPN